MIRLFCREQARNPDWHLTVPFSLFLGNRFPKEVFPELDPDLTVSFLFLLLADLKDFRVDLHVVLHWVLLMREE